MQACARSCRTSESLHDAIVSTILRLEDAKPHERTLVIGGHHTVDCKPLGIGCICMVSVLCVIGYA
jgi:hypothetical protein